MSALAAGIAAYAAYKANKAAQSLEHIERQRRHAELTPKFHFRVEGLSGTSKRIWVQLIGPSGLDQLDELTVSIRNNIRDISANSKGRPNVEDVENQIWGPYRFQQDITGVVDHGRSVIAPLPLHLGDDCAFILEETPTPIGYVGDSASWPFRFLPNRLTLLCVRKGYESWTIPVEAPEYLN